MQNSLSDDFILHRLQSETVQKRQRERQQKNPPAERSRQNGEAHHKANIGETDYLGISATE